MKNYNFLGVIILVICATVLATAPLAGAEEKYRIDPRKWAEARNFVDDPKPLPDYVKLFLPPSVYENYTYDIDKMKALQAEAVGFKAPDVVGKIAPEITPGKYTYQDKQSKPGLKQLMIPIVYDTFFKAAGPPFGGTFSEFEVVPTQQYYYCLPHLEATIKNRGKVKVDEQGFMDWKTFESGILFPKPSGSDRMKAMQIIYNWEFQYMGADALATNNFSLSWDKNLRKMSEFLAYGEFFRLAGRVTDEPFGFYDKRSQKLGEYRVSVAPMVRPRDVYGNITLQLLTLDANTPHSNYVYAATLRRVRKFSGTDTQDTSMGSNITYDDAGGFARKLSPTVFPYEYKILAEREYLVPEAVVPGATIYVTSEDAQIHNLKMVRRPICVVELRQKDPTYIYSRTVLYFDKENFDLYLAENYDQKGRLFRLVYLIPGFNPKSGIKYSWIRPNYNMLVEQTAIGWEAPCVPANYYTRDRYSLSNLQKFLK
ncbi:MAG: DUF1329 domain-containing protein [Desulfatitalea sp.]|nr:DUF1329 domain-containing protein [Desulfatitalea sp.]